MPTSPAQDIVLPSTLQAPLYEGAPSIARLLDDYLASVPEDAAEKKALALWQALQTKKRPDKKSWTALTKLQGQGSVIAAFAIGQALKTGKLPAAETRDAESARADGTTLLLDLCETGFHAAYAELVQDMTPSMLDISWEGEDSEKGGWIRARQDFVASGAQAGSLHCILLMVRGLPEGVFYAPDVLEDMPSRLLTGASQGCWECLAGLLRCYLTIDAGILPRVAVEEALAMLQQACDQDWLPALELAGDVVANEELRTKFFQSKEDRAKGREWYERAFRAGSLDAGAKLAYAVWTAEDGSLDKVRDILEQGLQQKHPKSLATMARVLWEDNLDSNWDEILPLVREAADLGETETSLRVVWEALVWQDVEWGPFEPKVVRSALDELLSRARQCPQAMHRLALYLCGHYMQSSRFSLPVPGYTSADVERLFTAALGQGCYAVCGSLSAICYFGIHGYDVDLSRATFLAHMGRLHHDLRSVAMNALLELDNARARSNDALMHRRQTILALHWADALYDPLAMCIMGCLFSGLGYGDVPLPDKDGPQKSVDVGLELFRLAMKRAIRCADVPAILYLARQFARCKPNSFAEELAYEVSDALDFWEEADLDEGDEEDVVLVTDPHQCALRLLDLANEFGAAHDGRFLVKRDLLSGLSTHRQDRTRKSRKRARRAKRR